MAISMKGLVTKETSKTVKKHVEIKPDQVADLLKKAVGAPEGTQLVTGEISVRDEAGNVVGTVQGYILDWTETPKARAPRKPKAEIAKAEIAKAPEVA